MQELRHLLLFTPFRFRANQQSPIATVRPRFAHQTAKARTELPTTQGKTSAGSEWLTLAMTAAMTAVTISAAIRTA